MFIKLLNKFETIEEVKHYLGSENLVAITNLKQIIFYCKLNIQPQWIDESIENEGRIVAYYLKSESQFAFKKWQDNRPNRGVVN